MVFLFFAKVLSTIVMVLGLSAVAEKVGPVFAGIFAGLPLGIAIVFIFVGMEQGPGFVVAGAPYAMAGIAATLVFNLVYWAVSSQAVRTGKYKRFDLPITLCVSLAAYLIAAFVITSLDVNVWTAMVPVVLMGAASVYAMGSIAPTAIGSRMKLTWRMIAIRAGMAAGVVIAVTGTAAAIGPQWAGLFAGFPITLLPLLVILHYSYSPQDAYSVLKGFPFGMPSLMVFIVVASLTFKPFGVPGGFAFSFGASVIWLIGYFLVKRNLPLLKSFSGR